MNRQQAIPYVAYIVDDAGCARELGADIHAIVRESGEQFRYASVLIGWQCGPLFVAVHSYLDVELTDGEAIELARDYLAKINWFAGNAPDYIIR